MNGAVKFYDNGRGFGFIVPDDGSADIFVHASAAYQAGNLCLRTGLRLAFDIEADTRQHGKFRAENLRTVGDHRL